MEKRNPTLTQQPTDYNPAEKHLSLIDVDQTKNNQKNDTKSDAHMIPINHGAFGCIFYPGIQCDGHLETRHYITKIQKQTHVTENEQYISQQIRERIPNYRGFFAPIMKQCPVQITKKYVNDIKQCDLFKEETLQTFQKKKYVSNKIRYLGTRTIKSYLFDIASGKIDPSEPRRTVPMGVFFWTALLKTHIRLLDAVRRLLKINVVHMDIKNGNVMIEPDTHKPILIDFGISIDQSRLVEHNNNNKTKNQAFYIYDTYTTWCFDIFLCNYIVHKVSDPDKVSTKEEIESILKEFQYGSAEKYPEQTKTRNDIFTVALIHPEKIQSFREQMVAEFAERPWKEIYDQCTQTNYSTWDNYGVATMYLSMLDMLNYSKRDAFAIIETVQTAKQTPVLVLEEYMKIIESIVYSPANKRPHIYTIRKKLRKLLRSL